MSSKARGGGRGAPDKAQTPPLPPYVQSARGACLLRVHVQPRAKRPGLAGLHGDRLKLRVAAPPAEGAANAACTELLARVLGVAPSALALVRGATSRDKDFAVAGLSPAEVARRVAAGPAH